LTNGTFLDKEVTNNGCPRKANPTVRSSFWQGKYQEGTKEFNEALWINPSFAQAHYNLGNAYLRIGNGLLVLKEYEILKGRIRI